MLREELPLRAAAHIGGGTTDNASDAINETKAVFKLMMDALDADPTLQSLRMSFGVERRAIIMGDPYHIDNLAVKWASVTAFGQTVRGDHRQTHHRQLLQSIHDLRMKDPVGAQNAMDAVMGGRGATAAQDNSRAPGALARESTPSGVGDCGDGP